LELQETDAVPLLLNDVWVIELQLRPEGTLSDSVRVLVKPWMREMVIVDVADEPAVTAEGEDAPIVKSGGVPNVNEVVAVWVSAPFTALIVTVYTLWLDELHDTVAVPDPATLVVLRAPHVSPEGTVSDIVTVPAKPFTAAREIVASAEEPGDTAEGEVALSRKSWNLNIAIVTWTRAPLVPIIVRR
jgi:hypothetical protein